jgi:hypothetical protein
MCIMSVYNQLAGFAPKATSAEFARVVYEPH